LDDGLACLNVKFSEYNRQLQEKLIKRLQRMHRLNAVAVESFDSVKCLLKHLPDHITTLAVTGYMTLCLTSLKRLNCLTALELEVYNNVTGLEHICGLTKLRHRYE
jgi:hypothetical protein